MASYVVTVIGLPLAILALIIESRRERANEKDEISQRDEEIYRQLSEEYVEFLKLALQYPELGLLSGAETEERSYAPTDHERRLAMFGILVALFERAYILIYEEKMTQEARRRWQSWHDYMAEWCRRSDFRGVLPKLLEGEDKAFTAYIQALVAEAEKKNASAR